MTSDISMLIITITFYQRKIIIKFHSEFLCPHYTLLYLISSLISLTETQKYANPNSIVRFYICPSSFISIRD